MITSDQPYSPLHLSQPRTTLCWLAGLPCGWSQYEWAGHAPCDILRRGALVAIAVRHRGSGGREIYSEIASANTALQLGYIAQTLQRVHRVVYMYETRTNKKQEKLLADRIAD